VIPQLVTVRVRRPRGRPVNIWIPVLPVLLVLSPVLIVALVVAFVACLIYRLRPVRSIGAVGRLFGALRGTRIDVEQGRTAVLVEIS
jgi:hypothetical protein